MKIGLSYSRCVLDIVEGRVDINDVLVIIARTDFDPHNDQQWSQIWQGYTTSSGWIAPEWSAYAHRDDQAESQFKNVTQVLYSGGKIHQPRQFGTKPQRYPWHWLECFLPPEELSSRPTVKDAWDRFKVVAELSTVDIKSYSQN